MEKVTGIEGLFFRAHDPTALGNWYYQQHLGVSLTPSSYEESVWQPEAGREIRSNCGSLKDGTLREHRVPNSGVHQIAPANTEGIVEQTRKGSVLCQIPPSVAREGYQRSIRCKDLTSPRRR
jgi:hypothetical protein